MHLFTVCCLAFVTYEKSHILLKRKDHRGNVFLNQLCGHVTGQQESETGPQQAKAPATHGDESQQ